MTNKGSNRDVSDLIREEGKEWALSKKEHLGANSLSILERAHKSLFSPYSQGEMPIRVRANAQALFMLIERLKDDN